MSSREIYFFLGPGGVGKTTCAASFALALEKKGLRSVVMTVDPARRLAQALGLQELENSPKRVFSSNDQSYVDALWLQNKNALKDLASRHIKDKQVLSKVVSHSFFSVIENQLGGIEEYLGVEKALSLFDSDKYDACVIDTPPSHHALEFLESPKHLMEFFDDSVLKYFLAKNSQVSSTWYKKLLHFGQNQAWEVFRRIVGIEFFTELAELLLLLKPVYESLKITAHRAESLFSSPSSHYVFVSTLEPDPFQETQRLYKQVQAAYPNSLKKNIWNRVLPTEPPPSQELMNKAFGKLRAQNLIFEWNREQEIRKSALVYFKNSPFANLSRVAIRQMQLNDLRFMGEEILNQWTAKSANISLKL